MEKVKPGGELGKLSHLFTRRFDLTRSPIEISELIARSSGYRHRSVKSKREAVQSYGSFDYFGPPSPLCPAINAIDVAAGYGLWIHR